MKKTLAILLTLIFVFALTSVTFAAKKKAAAAKQATGEVTAVDAKANTITVKATKGDVTVSADDKTKFMPKGKTIADIMAGDKVKVTYTEADGKMTAKSVTIMPAAKKKEVKKATPAAAPAAPDAPAAPAKKKSAGY